MASPDGPLGLVFSPLVSGVFSVYNPSAVLTPQEAILTEDNHDLLAENGSILTIE